MRTSWFALQRYATSLASNGRILYLKHMQRVLLRFEAQYVARLDINLGCLQQLVGSSEHSNKLMRTNRLTLSHYSTSTASNGSFIYLKHHATGDVALVMA